MTVRELRQELFRIKDQDLEVVVDYWDETGRGTFSISEIRWGHKRIELQVLAGPS